MAPARTRQAEQDQSDRSDEASFSSLAHDSTMLHSPGGVMSRQEESPASANAVRVSSGPSRKWSQQVWWTTITCGEPRMPAAAEARSAERVSGRPSNLPGTVARPGSLLSAVREEMTSQD